MSTALDVETIRVELEREIAAALAAMPEFALLLKGYVARDAESLRRELLAQGLRISAAKSPELHAAAAVAAKRLGITTPIEIYLAAALGENPALHLVEAPVLVEVQSRVMANLDDATRVAALGHELGHYLAHGPVSPLGRVHAAARRVSGQANAELAVRRAAQRLAIAGELTADRFALLACRDLDAAVRLQLICSTGLSSTALSWDPKAYLAQARALAENPGATPLPEHCLRAYALALFAETAEYRQIAGGAVGGRPLAEVDALVRTLLDRGEPDEDLQTSDSPPAELYECALAGAVLVALADDDFSEEEQDAIEKIFASLQPNLREQLSRDVALATFHRTSDIVAAHGGTALRTVFELLVQVMIADGNASAKEQAMVLALGEALRAGTLFSVWLSATMQGLGQPLVRDDEPKATIPLPVRSQDAGAALTAFCEGMARRGGGETTLRRLMRLLGAAAYSEEVQVRIEHSLAAAKLTATAQLDSSRLDERVVLTAPAVVATPVAAAAPLDADRAALCRAIGRLRDDLVSGDGRSPSVRLRKTRVGRSFDLASLDRISVGAGERVLAQLRAGKKSSLVTADEIGKHEPSREVSSELVELHREFAARLADTGADDLYVGYPLLTGTADGYLYRAPLVLYPVTLVRGEKGARGFELLPSPNETPVVNQSLLRLVFHKKKFALPEELQDTLDELASDDAQGPEAVIAALAQLGLSAKKLSGALTPLINRDAELEATREHCEVEECAVLGLFPQSSSDLLQDYDGLLEELAVPTADLAKVLGAARALLPTALRGPAKIAPPDESELQPAISADPSQREVLREARTATALVVDGPPGTGKSQVIANLVVDAIARGETVAVVCEKRAAIDVVARRLSALGLGDGLAVVHDVFADRKPLYAQLAARLEADSRKGPDEAARRAVFAAASAVERELDARRDAIVAKPPGSQLTVGQLHTFIAGLDAPPWPGQGDLSILTDEQRDSIAEAVTAIWPHRDLVGPGGVTREPPGATRRPSLSAVTDEQLGKLATALDQTVVAATALATATTSGAPDARAVLAQSSRLEALAASRDARADLTGQQLFVSLATSAGATSLRALDTAREVWSEERASVLALGTIPKGPADETLANQVQLVQAWAGRFLRFFALAWWRARGAVKRAIATYLPERAGHPLEAGLLGQLAQRLGAARGWSALTSSIASLPAGTQVPSDATAADSLVAKLAALSSAAHALTADPSGLAAIGLAPSGLTVDNLPAWDATLSSRLAQRNAALALAQALAPVRERLPWLTEATNVEALRALQAAFTRDGGRLRSAEAAIARARDAVPAAGGLVDATVDACCSIGDDSPERALASLRAAHAAAVLTAFEQRNAVAANLADELALAREHQLSQELSGHEEKRAAAQVAEAGGVLTSGVLAQTRAAKPRARRTEAQSTREAMLKETKKQRRVMPLRTFVRKFADEGLLELTPVWLLSPETMAILFPRAPLFDQVIFDEASQCTVESGLPVLLRAERVIIAGDDKQMPPTSFFTASAEDSDGVTEDHETARDLLAEESLLTLAQLRVPRRRLRWHYRCRDESLIAFSNHAMYDGQLFTVPSTATATASPALHWHAVEAGVYDDGKNRVEAEAVVDLLAERLARKPAPSVGVVTFNLVQRATVHEAIDARRASDENFALLWDAAVGDESLDQRPFVKNLESVQGDERDIIIFSLGHSPVPRRRGGVDGELYVPARFGPLGQRGGERRLNVAISRAKAECVVVASFAPSQLSVAGNRNLGPVLFKQYLEYANHLSAGRRAQAERVLELASQSGSGVAVPTGPAPLPCTGYVPLAVQIGLALEARGIQHELQVGSSSFRVPIAVIDPKDATRFRLAILTDEGDDPAGALERYVHRPLVLGLRGFELMRINAAEWRARPSAIVAKIEQRLAASASKAV